MALSGLVVAYLAIVDMPGRSHEGPLPPMTAHEEALKTELARDVEMLATSIGERNLGHPGSLRRSVETIAASFTRAGYTVARQPYETDGQVVENLEVEIRGQEQQDEVVVVGAHYDSAVSAPGADDNGSGVAALLAIGRHFAGAHPKKSLRLVAFANEEPPHFKRPTMGSVHSAASMVARPERVVAMLSLESMGYFSTRPESQKYPFPLGLFYPSVGDFIAFVGDHGSRDLVRRSVRSFRGHTPFPCEGGAPPGRIPGVDWSDHWAFRQHGIPAIMVTDTAPFRNPHYHEPSDRAETLDYERLARVVAGVERVISEWVSLPVLPR